ncbi:MAG: DUF349 domain-containing protein, partial [Gammaproteobacteria bacterium]|nr:DUF349 domain-containing protein [Gammaproteobacteria bacterium]
LHKQIERRNRDLVDIDRLLEQMDSALKDGQLKSAANARDTVRNKLNKIVALSEERRQPLLQRLEQAEPRLRELNAWRHWGTSVARENLIEQVRTLHDKQKSPIKVAQAIRDARKTWQEWDKSGDSGGKELWERFDSACSEAYQPCKKFFDERSAERAKNLQHRENMCTTLEQRYQETEWRSPDWRDIDKTIQNSKRDWRTAGPVDRKAKKHIDQRFEQVCSQFEEFLERERTRDHKRRVKLIEDVQALIEKENIDQAIDEVKTAQKKWSPTVLGHHRIENQLWKEFKSACDAIFERRGQQKQAEGKQRQENLLAKQQLCADLEQQIKQPTEEGFNPDSVIAQAQDRWQKIGEVPRKEETGIDKRFRRACANINKHAKSLANQAKAKSLELLQQQAQLCVELEALALDDDSTKSADELHSAWQSLNSDGNENQINERYELVTNAISDAAALSIMKNALDNNLAQAQDICLQLEVLCDIDSPNEFAKQRMQFQIQRLSAAMSKHTDHATEQDPNKLLKTYWLTGAIGNENRKLLDERIASIRAALNSTKHENKD